MKITRAIPLLFLVFGLAPLSASAQVFKCVESNGKIVYTNERISQKDCSLVSSAQVSTIPMRPAAAAGTSTSPAPASFPKISNDAQRERDKTRRQVLESELSSEQAALEEAQKKLSEQENMRVGNETTVHPCGKLPNGATKMCRNQNYQAVLDRLQPFKEEVVRRERNIEALNTELSNLR